MQRRDCGLVCGRAESVQFEACSHIGERSPATYCSFSCATQLSLLLVLCPQLASLQPHTSALLRWRSSRCSCPLSAPRAAFAHTCFVSSALVFHFSLLVACVALFGKICMQLTHAYVAYVLYIGFIGIVVISELI